MILPPGPPPAGPIPWSLLAAGLILLCVAAGPGRAQTLGEPQFLDLRQRSSVPSSPSSALTTEVIDGLSELEELVEYAAKAELTEAEQERSLQIVNDLGSRRPFRRAIVRLLMRHRGRLDRWINRLLDERAWKLEGPLPNYSPMDAAVLRGGEPNEEGFRQLRGLHVRTIVNLRAEDESERPTVSSLGMRYISVPLPDTDAPTVAQAEQFVRLCAAATPDRKLFFHCSAGKFRTGTMAAVYRMSKGMTAEDALAEARQYGWMESWLNADREAEFVRRWPSTHPAPRRTGSSPAAGSAAASADRTAAVDFGGAGDAQGRSDPEAP